MTGINFEIKGPPAKFLRTGNYSCYQPRTKTVATPFRQDIKLFQPSAYAAVFQAQQAARVRYSHGITINPAGDQNESMSRLCEDGSDDPLQRFHVGGNAVLLQLGAEKCNHKVKPPAVQKGY
jgi:hypothetical protein